MRRQTVRNNKGDVAELTPWMDKTISEAIEMTRPVPLSLKIKRRIGGAQQVQIRHKPFVSFWFKIILLNGGKHGFFFLTASPLQTSSPSVS
jgi:hypothetical protein